MSIIWKLRFTPRRVELVTDDARYFVKSRRDARDIALTWDLVRAQIIKKSDGSRLAEVRIVNLLERSNEVLLWEFVLEETTTVFRILAEQGRFEKRFSHIPLGYTDGDIVACKFSKKWELLLLQKFANKSDFDSEEKILFALHDVHIEFSKKVQEECENLKTPPLEWRQDFRDWYTLTIDWRDAKDLDDALSIRLLPNGHWYLGVHIADVSAYVREWSTLDREARERATSIYTPGKVIPMLPEKLSNDLCSLHPGSPKLALSCLMEIDSHGMVQKTEIVESIIQSQKKGIYERIETMHQTQTYDSNEEKETIETLYSLYDVLKKRRKKEGKILFESTETYFDFDAPEKSIKIPSNVRKRTRVDAHMLIEECMILANEEVAKWCSKRWIPFLSRVHGLPGNEQSRFIEYVLGKKQSRKWPKQDIEPLDIRNFMDALEDDAVYKYSRLLLPKMAKATYADKMHRHFGLALEYYAHFTSPIRRYPDLQIHRIIKESLHGILETDRKKHYQSLLRKVARHSSEMERRAEDIERQFDTLYACRYMESRVWEVFDARISGITPTNIYVELSNGIESSITLPYDTYKLNETTGTLQTFFGKTLYEIWQTVRVTIDQVNLEEKKIYASLIGASFWQL